MFIAETNLSETKPPIIEPARNPNMYKDDASGTNHDRSQTRSNWKQDIYILVVLALMLVIYLSSAILYIGYT